MRIGKSGGSVLRRSRSFGMVNQTLVLRINPDSYRDGENRQLLVAAKRYASYHETLFNNHHSKFDTCFWL